MRRWPLRLLAAAAIAALLPCLASAQTIRSGRVLVPVDVRVVDRDGKPVAGLTAEDFIVAEDGVPQTVSVFDTKFVEGSPDPEAPQQGRTFLILLRRMWLPSEPFDTTAAITAFIRQLGPNDRVAVSFWHRVSAFTSRRERAADIVDRLHRFQAAADKEKQLELYGYMFRPIPAEINAELDEVFNAGGLRFRTLPRAEHPRVSRLVEDVERRAVFGAAGGIRPVDAARFASATVLDLFAGIQHLRYEPGEKHLVYFARGGLHLASAQDDHHLARLASDARVAFHVVQTGGVEGQGGPSTGPRGMTNPAFDNRAAGRTVAEMTGGTASFADWPARALTRIDTATRGGYLLGYYPLDQSLDDRHRRITVTVEGPRGATVHYRRSYRAQPPDAAEDDRVAIIQDRILMAAGYDRVIPDLKFDASVVPARDKVTVKVRADAAHLSLEAKDGLHVGSLELAFFCTDRRERLVGEFRQTVNLKLEADTLARIQTEGLRHEVTFPTSEFPAWCKVVAYDYVEDRLGSVVVKLR